MRSLKMNVTNFIHLISEMNNKEGVTHNTSIDNSQIAGVLESLSNYDQVVGEWLDAKNENRQEFLENPLAALSKIPSLESKDVNSILSLLQSMQKPNMVGDEQENPYADESSEYFPPTTNYTNSWDMICATHVKQINEAFQKFFKYPKAIVYENDGIKVDMEVSDLDILEINGSYTTLQVSLSKMNIYMEVSHTNFTMNDVKVRANVKLEECEISTNDDALNKVDVILHVKDAESIKNIDFEATKPDNIGDFFWSSIVTYMNYTIEKYLTEAINKPYTLFSFELKEEKKEKLDWIIPNEARFSGAESASKNPDDDFVAIYAQTINPMSNTLALDIKSDIVPNGNFVVCGFSQHIAMEYIFMPAFNAALNKMYGTNENIFIYDVTKKAIINKKKFTVTSDGENADLNNTEVKMTDKGLHFETDFYAATTLFECEGRMKFNIYPQKKGAEIVFYTTKPIIDSRTSMTWKAYLISFFLMIIPPVGILFTAVLTMITAFANIFVDTIIPALTLEVDIPVDWKHINIVSIDKLKISDGILIEFISNVCDNTTT